MVSMHGPAEVFRGWPPECLYFKRGTARRDLPHAEPKRIADDKSGIKEKENDETIQSSNGGVLYGADGRDPRTKCKSGRLEQEDHDDLQRSG